jgi:hypothetical protein
MSRYLTDLADVCRRTGWPVLEVDGWQTRARGSGGFADGKPDHVMCHHTASGPSSDGWGDVNYMTHNHDDAPLCNLYLDRSGTIWVCAAGGTNTNGKGDCSHISPDTMNSSAVGIEAGNDGVGERWPDAQQDAYVALCRVLCDAYGIGVDRVHGHAEWAPDRKIDMAGNSRYATGGNTWDFDAFRHDVTGIGTPEPGPAPTPDPEEDDMPKPFLVTAPDGRWYCTDLATYKTYVGHPGAATDALGTLAAWQGAGDGPWLLGDQWTAFLDALPNT